LVDRASFINTLFLFQLDTLSFSLLQFFSTYFGPAGPSPGESNYTCSIWQVYQVGKETKYLP